MRDSYFARPLRDIIDHLLQSVPGCNSRQSELYHLSWELELLLLDERSEERQWRQAAARPLAKLEPLVRDTPFTERMAVAELRSLVFDLAT